MGDDVIATFFASMFEVMVQCRHYFYHLAVSLFTADCLLQIVQRLVSRHIPSPCEVVVADSAALFCGEPPNTGAPVPSKPLESAFFVKACPSPPLDTPAKLSGCKIIQKDGFC